MEIGPRSFYRDDEESDGEEKERDHTAYLKQSIYPGVIGVRVCWMCLVHILSPVREPN